MYSGSLSHFCNDIMKVKEYKPNLRNTNMPVLGKLKEVPLRELWKNEASGFTNWLSEKENLDTLAHELNVPLELIKRETPVGRYSADILAKIPNPDAEEPELVVIENILEKSDHDHLGKMITYASGLDAKIVVLICEELKDEHKSAINWLNRISSGEVKFFAIKLEAWKIGDSAPAPAFSIICQPDNWAKTQRSIVETINNVSETKKLQYEFWKGFEYYLRESKSILRTSGAYPQHWYNCRIGTSKGHIDFTINTGTEKIGCELYMNGDDPKSVYKSLLEKKNAIETEIGQKLLWMELPEKHASRIKLEQDFDINNSDSYKATFLWLREYGEKFQDVFLKYLK